MNQLHVAIPVYNRVKAFKRLLYSFRLTAIPSGLKVNIHFFVDFSPHQNEIQSIIDDFEWNVGCKHTYLNKEHLGLNGNLIGCGRLALSYGHVLILEDDLLVSPNIWNYCQEIMQCEYLNEGLGIGLYSYARNDFQFPFYPLNVPYYLQRVCTWGQIFTAYQWEKFEQWLCETFNLTSSNFVKNVTAKLKDTWGRTFTRFLKDTNQFFLYPSNYSISTNFADLGSNVKRKNEENAFQVPLQMDSQLPEVPKIEETTAVYDAYFELLPSRMKRLNPILEPYEFEVDLYGTKPFKEIEKPYVLSCKKALNPEMTFGRNLKPHELNIAYEIEGQDFFLARKEHFQENLIDKWRRELRTHYYHYPDVGITKTLKMKIFEILNRFL